jgi:hypothetical protein
MEHLDSWSYRVISLGFTLLTNYRLFILDALNGIWVLVYSW